MRCTVVPVGAECQTMAHWHESIAPNATGIVSPDVSGCADANDNSGRNGPMSIGPREFSWRAFGA